MLATRARIAHESQASLSWGASECAATGPRKAMVKQRRFSDLTDEAKERARTVVRRFTKSVCSASSASGLGVLRLRDAHDRPRKLYTHQVIAAQRLLARDGRAPWAQRKASMLAIHEVGTGKTITGLLVLAGVRVLNPHRADTKTLIVCPLSVLDMWHASVRAWTTLGDDQVLAACKQAALTESAIARASEAMTMPEPSQSLPSSGPRGAWSSQLSVATTSEPSGVMRVRPSAR